MKYDIDHIVSTCVMRAYFNTSVLPRFIHLITTMPIVKKHNTIVRSIIKLSKLLFAKFNSLVKPAHITMVLIWR